MTIEPQFYYHLIVQCGIMLQFDLQRGQGSSSTIYCLERPVLENYPEVSQEILTI